MKKKYHIIPRILGTLFMAVGLLALLASWFSASPAQAQTVSISVDKQLGRANPVIGVGEYITFTIDIINQSAFTVTTLPLHDEYNNGVLAYVDASITPDSIDPDTGHIIWSDLTTHFGNLPPGQAISITVGFIAEHPSPTIVNYAEVRDALADQDSLDGGSDDSSNGESIGGSAPVDKKLIGDVIPEVGMPLTFTIAITNDGYTTMTVVPLLEDYDPAFLQFSHALPPPDTIDEVSGELNWSDLTVWLGDVTAQQAISITAVFTALAPIDITNNAASIDAFQDWYGNDLAGGSDLVPIIIVDSAPQTTPTATAQATSTRSSSGGDDNDATATIAATATVAVAATATHQLAAQMPATGIPPATPLWPTLLLMSLLFLLPLGVWFIWKRHLSS